MVAAVTRTPVWVRWIDSANLFQDRWAAEEELDRHMEQTFCETVGFLLRENTHSLYLAGSVAPEEIGSVMQIPKVAIVERHDLERQL